ncbi:MAG TPA: hypothetical protein VHC73_05930 [Vitreimonas sp.]|jgi:hypothetical protein|nr:hypothetical protein [Vitreimonas sp.]
MCGSGEGVYGIVAGLIGAAAILVMAYAEKHGGEVHAHKSAQAAVAYAVQVASPVSVGLRRSGAHLDINLRF